MNQLKVLVVEDDADVLASLCQVLSFWGHRVVAAASVAEAETALEAYAPEVILSDWDLAGDRPTVLLQRARKRMPLIGVVLMSGSHGDEVTAAVARGLAHVAISKPFELEALRQAITVAHTHSRRDAISS
jgi:DNA-binding NtrC family response regulator